MRPGRWTQALLRALALLSFIASVSPVSPVASVDATSELPPQDMLRQLREARIAFRLGEGDKGVEILRRAAAEHPREGLPILALLAYSRSMRADAAELIKLHVLLRSRLLDPEAKVPAASVRQLVEDPDITREDLPALREALETRLKSAPSDLTLLDALARVQDRLEDPAAARVTLGKVAAIRPDQTVLWQCASLDRQLGRWESVVDGLRQIRAKFGDSPWLGLLMIEALGKTGRYDETLKEVERFDAEPALRKSTVGPLLGAAWSLEDAGKREDAQKAFRKVLAIEPENTEAGDAVLHLYAGAEERASLQSALDESWNKIKDPFALQKEGVSRLSAGDALGALALLKRSAEALPGSETAWFNYGLAALRLERWEEARQAMARSAEIAPTFANAHLNLGAALEKLKRCPEAIVEL
jgi:tetratricopeptide (TPR) repeat protein